MSARSERAQPSEVRRNLFPTPDRGPRVLCLRCGAAVAESATGFSAKSAARAASIGHLPPKARVVALSSYGSEAIFSERLRSRFDLTRMETAVARGLLDGLSYKEIAEEFEIGYETVHSHVKAIHEKAGVGTTRQFIALFLSGR
jgi:DNA-binding CsgD family transcriptional regulator